MNLLNNDDKNLNLYAKYIEELFTDLMSGEDKYRVFKSMKKTLNKIAPECADIFIQKNSDTNGLYGMSVYLKDSSLLRITKSITDPREKTKDLTKDILNTRAVYYIEIDSRILQPQYGFKADEITAILLHEIGHVLGDTDFYNELKAAYEKAIFEMNDKELKEDKLNDVKNNIGMLYVISALQNTHMSKFTPDEKEQLADKFAVDCGYGEPLVRALEKFSKLNISKLSKKNIFQTVFELAKTNLYLNSTFKTRRKYVDELLQTEEKITKSDFLKDSIKSIRKKLSKIFLHEALEGFDLYNKEILDESFFDMFRRKPIKTSQADIDNLKIEIEMMEDYDDKSAIVYKIHKRLTQLEEAKKKLVNDSEYKRNLSLIESYKKQLNELLKQALKFKVVEKTYGVFVKYPKGYEG